MKGNLVYLYAALKALWQWKPATLHADGRRRAPRVHRLQRRRSATRRPTAAACSRCRTPSWTTASSTCCWCADDVQAAFVRRVLPKVFKGTHGERRRGHVPARASEIEVSADRPFTVYADGDPIADLPVHDHRRAALLAGRRTVARLMFRLKTALARLVRAATRRLGKGGTTAPGRVLLRLDSGAMGRLGKRLEGGAMLISATNGKTTTASLLNGILEHAGRPVVRNRAGSNMHWGVTTALLDAGRAPGELGLLEVDEAWLPRVSEELEPRAFLLGNLFRDQLDRYGELELIADRWAEVVADRAGTLRVRAERRRPAGRRPGPRARAGHLLRRRGRLARAARAPARRRLQALPPLRPRLRVRRGLPGPHGPLPLPELRARAARARGRRREGDAARHGRHRRRHAAAGRRADRAVVPPARPLQRLQRAGRGGRRRRAGRRVEPHPRRAVERRRRVRPRRAPEGRRPRRRDPAGQEPRRRERGAAHADARGRPGRPVARAERPDRRRARRLLDLGRGLRAAGRPGAPRDVLAARAPRRWRCG